jgi:hypothetical protein
VVNSFGDRPGRPGLKSLRQVADEQKAGETGGISRPFVEREMSTAS